MQINQTFVDDYIKTWATTDDTERSELANRLYADDATFYAAEPGDEAIDVHGPAAIAGNIRHVNVRDTQNNGIRIQLNSWSVNHDLVKVSWRMIAPNDQTVANGTSVLLVNDSNEILRDYIFVTKA